MNGYIYVVEDDENIQTLLELALKSLEYNIKIFSESSMLYEACKENIPELIFLDIMLPGEDGFQILKKLKSVEQYKDIPVVFLSAKTAETDKVIGLEGGAEDYITKPFSVLELLSRTKKILARKKNVPKENIMNHKDISIHKDMFEVYQDEKLVELTLKEYRLLLMLIENKGKVVLRNELLDKIWGINFEGETRTLDMHIKTLRAKLGDSAEHPKYIKTVRGAGYTIL